MPVHTSLPCTVGASPAPSPPAGRERDRRAALGGAAALAGAGGGFGALRALLGERMTASVSWILPAGRGLLLLLPLLLAPARSRPRSLPSRLPPYKAAALCVCPCETGGRAAHTEPTLCEAMAAPPAGGARPLAWVSRYRPPAGSARPRRAPSCIHSRLAHPSGCRLCFQPAGTKPC